MTATNSNASVVSLSKQQRYQATKKVTLVSVATNIVLSIAQLFGGFFTHSQALIADGIHTLSDLISDFIVLIAAKFASQDADDEHPYGHGRFETVATVVLGILLSAAAVGIFSDAVIRLFDQDHSHQPAALGVVFALLAVISKEGLYQYTMRVAKQIDSDMLRANAWHHRSDAISSLVVLIGLGGAVLFGIPWLDSIAAMIVSLMILRMGIRLAMRSFGELVDSAVEPEQHQAMTQFINQLDGIESLHMLRTRKMGGRIFADVHIQVNPYISVSEGHAIAETSIMQLKHQFNDLEDITIHIDPEDDELSSESARLPNRAHIEALIDQYLSSSSLSIDQLQLTLHYLAGKLAIEIHAVERADLDALYQLKAELKGLDYVQRVMLYRGV